MAGAWMGCISRPQHRALDRGEVVANPTLGLSLPADGGAVGHLADIQRTPVPADRGLLVHGRVVAGGSMQVQLEWVAGWEAGGD